jgi:hypothetical protein
MVVHEARLTASLPTSCRRHTLRSAPLKEVTLKIVSCSIFRAELEHVLGASLQATWLAAGLHVSDERLGEALDEALGSADGVACLYGACHPDLDARLAERGGRRLDARNCIEAFLSPEERAKLGERAFIISPGWLREWRSIFVEGLGWDEIDGRINFGMYEVIVLLDFGLEPIDDLDVLEFFDFTQTEIETLPATLDYFRARVAETLDGDALEV